MMEQDDGHVIVDVRRQDEFETGHIPGAICIPNETIGTEQPKALPDLDQIILVYCRSGSCRTDISPFRDRAIRTTSRRTMIFLTSNFRKTRWTGSAAWMNREDTSTGDRKGLRTYIPAEPG
jgi:protein tyrosine phosphatase (PTP) superfamily phosphohydrolase (DUF442 family)